MKYLIFILILTVFSISNTFSQKQTKDNNCIYTKNDLDEFTGKEVKILQNNLIGTNKEDENSSSIRLVAALMKNGDKEFLKLGIVFPSSLYLTAGALDKAKDNIMFKFENDTVLKFSSLKYSLGEKLPLIDKYEFETQVLIDSSYHEFLESIKISKIRIYFTKNYIDFYCQYPEFFIHKLNCIKK